MSEHQQNVIEALNECKHGAGGSGSSAVSRVAKIAADANRARFAESIRVMGASLPFRKDGRSRERQIQEVLRLARLAAQNRRSPRPQAGGEHLLPTLHRLVVKAAGRRFCAPVTSSTPLGRR